MCSRKDKAEEDMEQIAEQIRDLKKIAEKWNKEETELKSHRIEVYISKLPLKGEYNKRPLWNFYIYLSHISIVIIFIYNIYFIFPEFGQFSSNVLRGDFLLI